MAKLVFGMHQSLDGYIADPAGLPRVFAPGPELSRHFTEHIGGVAGMIYGARMYEVMQYWDDDQPGWDEGDHAFAALWRPKPKWVVSRSLTAVGPNATLAGGDLESFARKLKAEVDGEIDVAGAELAASLSALGLIDEYRIYLRPFVFGAGKPFFASAPPPLRPVSSDRVGEDAVRLVYVPA